jgi:hypothetical protein
MLAELNEPTLIAPKGGAIRVGHPDYGTRTRIMGDPDYATCIDFTA